VSSLTRLHYVQGQILFLQAGAPGHLLGPIGIILLDPPDHSTDILPPCPFRCVGRSWPASGPSPQSPASFFCLSAFP